MFLTAAQIDYSFKILGIVWSIVAFVVAAVFFLGGEWTRWDTVKKTVLDEAGKARSQQISGIPTATEKVLEVKGNLEVPNNRWDGEEATRRALRTSMFRCPEGTYVVGMQGIKTDTGKFCTTCISEIEFVCRGL
jgi:hypothetical protein